MHPVFERQIRSELPRFRLPWVGLAASTIALAWLGIQLSASGFPTEPLPEEALPVSPLGFALAACGVLCALVVLYLDRTLLAPGRLARRLPVPDSTLALRHLLAGHLVLWVLSGVPALLGFALLLLGGPVRIHLALCGLSLGTLGYLMPTSARITARVDTAIRKIARR